MTQKKSDSEQDQVIRKALENNKIKASENLKFRIMQQIQTEKALSKDKIKIKTSAFKNILIIFGFMYLLVILSSIFVYVTYANTLIEDTSIAILYLCIISIFSMLALIIAFDERRRYKQKK